MRNIREDARALGGEAHGTNILCPGPGHSKNDRSLSLRRSVKSPIGYWVHSFAGDDITVCLDLVRHRLGLPEFAPGTYRPPEPDPEPEPEADDKPANLEYARKIWHEAGPVRETRADPEPAEPCLFWPARPRSHEKFRKTPALKIFKGTPYVAEGFGSPRPFHSLADLYLKEVRGISLEFGHRLVRSDSFPSEIAARKEDHAGDGCPLARYSDG